MDKFTFHTKKLLFTNYNKYKKLTPLYVVSKVHGPLEVYSFEVTTNDIYAKTFKFFISPKLTPYAATYIKRTFQTEQDLYNFVKTLDEVKDQYPEYFI